MMGEARLIGSNVGGAIASPRIRAAYSYWRSKADIRPPRRADLKPIQMKAFLTHVILLEVRRDPLDFNCRLVGSAAQNCKLRLTPGVALSERESTGPTSKFWRMCAWVVENERPLLASTPGVPTIYGSRLSEKLICPLVNDYECVEKLFIITDFSDP